MRSLNLESNYLGGPTTVSRTWSLLCRNLERTRQVRGGAAASRPPTSSMPCRLTTGAIVRPGQQKRLADHGTRLQRPSTWSTG